MGSPTTRLQHKLERGAERVRHGQAADTLRLGINALFKHVLRIHKVVITRGEAIPDYPLPGHAVFRRLAPGELLPLAALSKLEPPPDPHTLRERFQSELARGRNGYVATVGDDVVAYAWVGFGTCRIPEVQFDLHLHPDEAYTHRSYVAPEYRFSRMYGGLASFVLTDLRRRGIRWFVGCGSSENRHSILTHRRLGYEVVGWILLVETFFVSLQLRKLQSESNRTHWSLRRRSRPTGEDWLGGPEAEPEKRPGNALRIVPGPAPTDQHLDGVIEL